MITNHKQKYIMFFKLIKTRDLHYKNNMINLFNVFYWIKKRVISRIFNI